MTDSPLVLVVEYEFLLQADLELAFAAAGFVTDVASTGEEALNLLMAKRHDALVTQTAPPDTYVTVPSSDDLSSKVVGLDIYNKDNKDIGTIKDIALNPNGRTSAYIVSVGGFLGMGEHYVAVNPEAVNVTYKNNKWHADMNATADQLKAAPEFKYAGRWASNKM